VGLLVKYSPDVKSALQALVRYYHLRAQGAVITLGWQAGQASLGFEIYERHNDAVDQLVDGALAYECNIMRELCGADWAPAEVRFAHGEPQDTGPFRRFFRSPLSFHAGHSALSFDAAWLDKRLPVDDPGLLSLLQAQVNALEAEHGEDLPSQVRSVLRTALLTKNAQTEEVAALFSMHSRTLARRLEAHGTHFQALVDEVRFEIARQMLERSAMEVRDIAEMLGYADASALTRAFRRWSGTTPARWRLQQDQRDKPGR
jgi:AraC-like DNA-binding protein